MCGIFGFVSGANATFDVTAARRVIERLFLLSESRGKESSGIAVKDLSSRMISVLKRSIPAHELVQSKEFREFFNRVIASNTGRESSAAIGRPLAVIAHARLVTDGSQENSDNNQPVIKDGCVTVHNGIVTNVQTLWENRPDLKRLYEVGYGDHRKPCPERNALRMLPRGVYQRGVQGHGRGRLYRSFIRRSGQAPRRDQYGVSLLRIRSFEGTLSLCIGAIHSPNASG